MNMPAKYKLELIVFVSGAVVMVLELVGSRIVAPYFGNSLFVWTSLIGVILGALSLGYYFGGIVADRKINYRILAIIFSMSAIFIGVTAFFKEPLLGLFSSLFNDIRLSSLFSTIMLFFFPSFLLGMVSPAAAKLRIKELENSGKAVGTLYSISTLGSIVGTFLAGFVLIPFFGNTNLLYLLSATLIVLSVFTFYRSIIINISAVFLLAIFYYLSSTGLYKINALVDTDSQYQRIIIEDRLSADNQPIRTIRTDNSGLQSGTLLSGSDSLVFDYTKAFEISWLVNPKIKNALTLGGAGYSYPRYFADRHPDSFMDVVEIDPKMTEIAKKYFFLEDENNLNLANQDARIYFRNNHKKYDAIYVDVFNAITPPYYLTTEQYFEAIKNSLNQNGLVMINVLGALSGDKSKFTQTETDTLSRVFPSLYRIPLGADPSEIGNIMFVAMTSSDQKIGQTDNPMLKPFLEKLEKVNATNGQILTDDHAPVEYLTKNYAL